MEWLYSSIQMLPKRTPGGYRYEHFFAVKSAMPDLIGAAKPIMPNAPVFFRLLQFALPVHEKSSYIWATRPAHISMTDIPGQISKIPLYE